MAYGRRRSSGRTKSRRSSRTLSTRRIFNNKSARAQAAQISALKKRINRVYRRTKPEYKVLRIGSTNRSFGSAGSGVSSLENYTLFGTVLPQPGAGDNQRIGNKITMSPVSFFMNIRYTEVNQIQNNAVFPYVQAPLVSKGMMLRFIALQAIAADDNGPSMADIFQDNYTAPATSPQDLMMMMTMPFKNGITARYKILKDKRISVNHDKPIYAARFKVKPQIRTLRWEDGKTYPAGTIFYIMIGGGGDVQAYLDNSNETRYYNYNFLDTTWRYELPYTDA